MSSMNGFLEVLNFYKDISPTVINEEIQAPYIVTVSSYVDKYEPYKVFDNRPQTSWSCVDYEANPWIKIDFGRTVVASAIAVEAPYNYITAEGLEESIRNCEVQISDTNDDDSWVTVCEIGDEVYEKEKPKLFSFSKVFSFRYLRIYKENNTLKFFSVAELRILQPKNFYLIYDKGAYKTYDPISNSLVEVADASVLKSPETLNICIDDLSKIIPFLNELDEEFKIFSNDSYKIIVTGMKSNTELITANNDFPTIIHSSIDFFENQAEITGNCAIKITFSIDEGVTWKTHDGTDFIDLPVTIPCKPYNELTEDELIQWNNARDEILANGIDSATLKTLDFNTLTFDKIRFAYVLHIDSIEDTALNKRLIWQFDAKGSMKLMKDSEIDIEVLPTGIKVTPKIDSQMIKVNILPNGVAGSGSSGGNGSTTDTESPMTDSEIDALISNVLGSTSGSSTTDVEPPMTDAEIDDLVSDVLG